MPRTTVITENPPADSPEVIAYRVTQVEKAVNDGFKAVHEKLDAMKNGFVSHQQFSDYIKLADTVHLNFEERLNKLESWNSWIARLVGAAVILSLLALLIGTKFFSLYHG